MLTDLDQARVDKGVGYVHAEIDKLVGQGPARPRARRPSCAAWSPARSTRPPSPTPTSSSRPSSRTWRQEAGLGRGGEDRLARVRPRHQHLLAVGHRDGRRPGAPRAGGRLPLLQPGRGDAAAGDRPGRADRRRHAGHRVRGRQGAEEVLRAGQGRPGVRGQPAAHPLPRRGLRAPSTRAPRSRWPTRALDPLGLPMRPLALLQLVGPAVALPRRRRRCTRRSRTGSRVSANLERDRRRRASRLIDADGNDRPRGRRAAAGRRPRRSTAEQVRAARARRAGRRRSGSCSTRAWSPRRRTSTCA